MIVSQSSASVLVDLIENKIAVMQVDDRDDLREMFALQRCLSELKGMDSATEGVLNEFANQSTSRRGRRPKIHRA